MFYSCQAEVKFYLSKLMTMSWAQVISNKKKS